MATDVWRRLSGETVYDAGIFRVRRDHYELRGKPTRPFHVIECAPWINVVPLTASGEVVLVRQYRHGIQGMSLEVPGGVVDPADADPAAAAARELLEETGHAGAAMELLAAVSSNPAILENRTYCYLVRDVRRVADPCPDDDEDLEIEVAALDTIPARIAGGEIHHSLSVCALTLALARLDA
jgi:8-oxo-dGTP pyrophosphatase MutT (NUDIX family)